MRKWRSETAWRVAADAAIACFSLAVGFATRLEMVAFSEAAPRRAELLWTFLAAFRWQAPLLALCLTCVLALFGVYTRTRSYTRRHKTFALFQAISLSYAAFLLVNYLSGLTRASIPRGVFLIAYAITLTFSLGLRMAKSYIARRFTVLPARPSANRNVRKVLVVGGAGYIGSGLVRDLLADGYQVRVLDSLQYGCAPIAELLDNREFQLLEGDFRRVEPVVQAVRGMDAVIHLGAIVGDPACAVDEDATLETNLAATRLLADVCRASSVSRVLFASTCSVYGAADHLVNERSKLNPVSLYAATKIDSERVLLSARSKSFHPVILRLATAFGWSHRPRFDLVANLLVAKAAVERKVLIYNKEQWRPFIHVADISRAFRAVLAAPIGSVSGEIFNAGSNCMNFTLQQLAERISAQEPGLKIEYIRNADARNYRVQFDKIEAALGFQCRVSLETGIRELRQAIAEGRITDYQDPLYSNLKWMAQDRPAPVNGSGVIPLTALHFAPNSRWSRVRKSAGADSALLDSPIFNLEALLSS